MKINQLNIFGYGKLVNKKYDFNQLQIIYGLNESGKSTIISFIKSILFGFLDNRSNDGHYQPKSGDRYGGQLLVSFNDEDYIIERIYGSNGGNVKIIKSESSEELDEDFLKQILGPINRQNFDSLFYFGDLNLNEIKKMSERELIQRIQKIGVVGINDWLKLNDQFESTAKDIYKPTGKKDELHPLFNELDQLKLKLKETEKDYSEYLDLKDNVREYKKKIDELQNQIKKIKNDLLPMNNDVNQWENYQKLMDLNQQKLELKDNFNSNDYDSITKLVEQKRQIDNQIKDLNDQIIELKNENNSNELLSFYAENDNKIESLSNQNNEINYKNNQIKNDYDKQKQIQEKIDDLNEVENSDIKLMNNENLDYLINLLKEVDDEGKNKKNIFPVSLFIISIFIFISGFMIFSNVFNFLSVITLIVCGISGYFFFNSKNNSKQELNKIGLEYNMSDFSIYRWVELQNKLNQLNDLKLQEQKNNDQIKNTLDEINMYVNQWNFAKDYIDFNSDVSHNLTNIKSFIDSMKDIDKSITNKKVKLDNYNEMLNTLYIDQKNIIQKINQFYDVREIKSFDEFIKRYHEQENIKDKLQKKSELQKLFNPDQINRFSNYESKDKLKENINQKNSNLNDLENEISTLNSKYANDNATISNIVKNGLYSEIKQKIVNQEDEIKETIKKWLVYKLSSDWINKALFNATKGRIPMVQANAEKYFSYLTNHKYVKITYQKTKLKVVDSDKNTFDVQELSKGTMIQLYLSLVFSLTLAFSDDYPMPLIIDDGFVDFDSLRTKNAFKVLKEISESTQVLYFTANDQVLKYNDYHILKLD
ncbi:AAA family ATPase [Lactobacillus sp. S2-2]|uniref:ATP-binding protein n=1 Tax=Lactobacillus sp. S2-2 TaxID=2692917 RepID=UPI001F25A80D|nr:AAA family ATPase [Lactobacillus sp. S2-2]MCF6515167.1 AAA family ATPase [Lactobacillus sp. S2-2]